MCHRVTEFHLPHAASTHHQACLLDTSDGSILQISDQSEIVPDQICFLAQASTFYLPEKALSDEQMLELIDFYAKRDYSVTAVSYTHLYGIL